MNIRSFAGVRPGIRQAVAVGLAAAMLGGLSSCNYGSNYGFPTTNVPNSIVVADVNNDGVPDLLVAMTLDQGSARNPGIANVILGVQGSAGTFHTGVQYPTTGANPSSIAVGDLSGTGALDLVVANFSSGSVSVYMHGATPGTFKSAVNVATGGSPNQVAIGDVNGDGKADLILADSSSNGGVIVLFQDPANPGQFLAPVTLSTGKITAGVALADLNNDHAPDIVAAAYDSNGNNGAVVVFYQNPASRGTFLAPVAFPGGAQPQAVRVADLNGDTLPDIVVANQGPGSDGSGSAGVSVLLQDPAHPGSFLPPVTYATQAGAQDVAIGDLNGDNKPDLVVANLGPSPAGSVSVLLQDPANPGRFLTATSYLGFGQPLGVAIADLNNDGHPDIAVADGASATILLQVASAPGTFSPAVQVGR